jgi:hypothetical protein
LKNEAPLLLDIPKTKSLLARSKSERCGFDLNTEGMKSPGYRYSDQYDRSHCRSKRPGAKTETTLIFNHALAKHQYMALIKTTSMLEDVSLAQVFDSIL